MLVDGDSLSMEQCSILAKIMWFPNFPAMKDILKPSGVGSTLTRLKP